MNFFTKISKLTLICVLCLFVCNCQEKKATIHAEDETETTHLKSAVVSDYLQNLIATVEDVVADGLVSKRKAKAIRTKVRKAQKSIRKGNTKAARKQLATLINQVENLVAIGKISSEQGKTLIDNAENAILILQGYFTDRRDGQKYDIVLIGDQIWMAENLAYLPSVYPSGNPDLSYSDPRYYVYHYDGTNVSTAKAIPNYTKYGVLYNWPAAAVSCPQGWHLPSDDEWKELELAIGMSPTVVDEIGERGTNEGAKLKALNGWSNNGNGTDDYGFAALPGGVLISHDANFYNIGDNGYWWSSTEIPSDLESGMWRRILSTNNSTVNRNMHFPQNGCSVRCVKD